MSGGSHMQGGSSKLLCMALSCSHQQHPAHPVKTRSAANPKPHHRRPSGGPARSTHLDLAAVEQGLVQVVNRLLCIPQILKLDEAKALGAARVCTGVGGRKARRGGRQGQRVRRCSPGGGQGRRAGDRSAVAVLVALQRAGWQLLGACRASHHRHLPLERRLWPYSQHQRLCTPSGTCILLPLSALLCSA